MESRMEHEPAQAMAGTATGMEAGFWDGLELQPEVDAEGPERPVEELFPRYVCWLCTGVFGSEAALKRHLREHGLM